MKPKLLNNNEAKRFAAIMGYLLGNADDHDWGALDLRDCNPWNEGYQFARDAAYDIAKWHIGKADPKWHIAFNENQYQHHFALHAACQKTINAFSGVNFVKEQAGEDGNDKIFAERIDTFLKIYHDECLERGVGVETE